MTNDVVVSVKNVTKDFVLPNEKKSSVKSIFTSFYKSTGKPTTQRALDDISFDIRKGEFFGIVGRNGSGKSTLLKIIAEIYQPTDGSVFVKGKLVPFIELGVGFNPELTGRENVYLNGAIVGHSTAKTDKNYKKIVEFSELEEHMGQKLKNYSSGMQVRLAFACATMAEADVLLVDEVLAVGDADFQRKCFNYFRLLKKQKKTVVFVTHDMSAVREYCDRAILINDSVLAKEGSVNKISDEYTRLFVDETQVENDSNGGEVTVTGNGRLLIKKIKKIINVKSKDDKIKIVFELHAKNNVENPIVGFKLKTSADEQITGTNTKIEKCNIGELEKGDVRKIEFTMPNILNNGEYLVDIVAESRDGDICDWQIDAVRFEVVTEKKMGYTVEVPITVKVSNVK